MSELAPPGDLADESPPRQPNVLAVASLVSGLLVCIPLIAGSLAILLGLLGLRKTRDPRVGGRGLAVAGLILGVICLTGWAVAGFAFYRIARLSIEARRTAERFVDDLSRGRVNSALALSGESFDRANLNGIAENLKPLGRLQALDVTNVKWKMLGGTLRIELDGTARFARQNRRFWLNLNYEDGEYKVMSFDLP